MNLHKNEDAMVEKEKIRNELDSVKRELAQALAELFVFQRDINIRCYVTIVASPGMH